MIHITFSGTILSWVPKPNKATGNKATVPKCWVECDGRQISEGIWKGQKTPDLNNVQRFLRGGNQSLALEVQDDALQDHSHDLYDPGHTHSYNDQRRKHLPKYSYSYYYNMGRADWPSVQNYVSNEKTGREYTRITIKNVKTARTSTETRPKNMKVTFIMKVC